MKSYITSFLVFVGLIINLPTNIVTASTPSGGPEVVAYTASGLDSVALNNIAPGTTFYLAVTIDDPRLTAYLSSVSSTLVSSGDGVNISAKINQGVFTMGDVNNVGYHILDAVNGKFTIVFSYVHYNGGAPTFSFDLSYYLKNSSSATPEVPSNIPLSTVTFTVGQASDTSVQPEVILKNSSFGGGSVAAGQNFTLNTNAYNTSSNLGIENVIATVKLPDNIVVASGSSSVVVGNVGPNGNINASFALQAKPGAEAGTAAIVVEYTYYATVQGQKQQYTSSQSISVPITQKDRFEVYDISAPEIVSMGEEAYISLGFANKGKGIIYNLSASIEGSNFTVTEKQQYIGNIAAGTENSVDFYIFPEEMGTIDGTLKLTYEDANGTETVVKVPFSITVEEGFTPEYPITEPEMPIEPTGGGAWKWIVGLVVLVAAGAGGFLFYKKKKAQKEEAEDEDEDF